MNARGRLSVPASGGGGKENVRGLIHAVTLKELVPNASEGASPRSTHWPAVAPEKSNAPPPARSATRVGDAPPPTMEPWSPLPEQSTIEPAFFSSNGYQATRLGSVGAPG